MGYKFKAPNILLKKIQCRQKLNSFIIENKRIATTLLYGNIGFQSLETGWLTAKQIEAVRIAIMRALNKTHDVLWIRVKPNRPVTAKSRGIRMGKGKGLPKYWICKIKKGRILFEIQQNVSIFQNWNSIIQKLPLKIRIIKR